MKKYIVIPAALMLALSLSATAADKHHAQSDAESVGSGSDVGMRAYVDPETGLLTSAPVTAEQKEAAARAVSEEKLAPMVERRLEDGTLVIDLNGNFEMAQQQVVGADGKRYRLCTDAAHAAQASHIHQPAAELPSDEY